MYVHNISIYVLFVPEKLNSACVCLSQKQKVSTCSAALLTANFVYFVPNNITIIYYVRAYDCSSCVISHGYAMFSFHSMLAFSASHQQVEVEIIATALL